MRTVLCFEDEELELKPLDGGAMPVGAHAKRKAAMKSTWRDDRKSKAIGRQKQTIRNRRKKRVW